MTESTALPVSADRRLPASCGERTSLPDELAAKALAFGGGSDVGPGDVQTDVRCTLQVHATGDHFALVRDLEGIDTGSVWTSWIRGHRPADVFVLSDCNAVQDRTHEPCCEFTDHPGGHTFDIADPWSGSTPAQPRR